MAMLIRGCRAAGTAVLVFALAALGISCSEPVETDLVLNEEQEGIDLAITENTEDPLRENCAAALSEDPRAVDLTQAERDTRIDNCVVMSQDIALHPEEE